MENHTMNADKIWENKNIIGIVAVLIFAASCLLFVVSTRSEEHAWATIANINKTSRGTTYDILVRNKPDGSRLFRQIVKNPSGKLIEIKTKKKGDQFHIKITKSDEKWEISSIPEAQNEE